MSDNANIGRIKFFDPDQGYGYILTEGTDESMTRQFSSAYISDGIYFSLKDVNDPASSMQPNLREGQWVQFVTEETKAGLRATQITLVNPMDNFK
jgi:cold shock CspA family protein